MTSGHLRLDRGAVVGYKGSDWRIVAGINATSLWLEDPATHARQQAPIAELTLSKAVVDAQRYGIRPEILSERDRAEAIRRLQAIKPFLIGAHTADEMAERARALGVGRATLYRWISSFQRTGLLSSLVVANTGGAGRSRLTVEQEKALMRAIDEVYLTKQRLPLKAVLKEVKSICAGEGIRAPSHNTTRARIATIAPAIWAQRRFGKKAAFRFEPHPDVFPAPQYPLDVVQIDHTKLDIDLVDEATRLPIGRPWITMAIDVFSRMITGYYVSLDPPGDLSAGQCIAHSILTKESWLRDRGIESEWPCFGVMTSIDLDNAREFRGKTLRYACEMYGIDIQWRPVAKPHYGGHIELLLRTLAKEIHTLPGTTFSRTKDLHDYRPAEKASITLKEFDLWLAELIVCDYHQRIHSALKTSPVAKWAEGIFGKGDRPGRGYPAMFTDAEQVHLDFLPMIQRTIQTKGVVIDHIHYYHDVLRRFIGSKEEFIFKRNPKDISIIFFYDPEQKRYHEIPQRDISRPPMTLWALREITRGLVRGGKGNIDEQLIYASRERRLQIITQATQKTEAARRKFRRLAPAKPADPRPENQPPAPTPAIELQILCTEDLEPYEVRED
ncbi:MAG TPA: Mu transposase C-terminal domain-containing protein [Edaphobacter sp.]|nr:Mu transposase C-terminal domain-containing protein [Edaphobacter sp.]